jgi:hypothetical protein
MHPPLVRGVCFRRSTLVRVSVREGGVEPPRPFGHTDLNRARLPVPPLAQRTTKADVRQPEMPRQPSMHPPTRSRRYRRPGTRPIPSVAIPESHTGNPGLQAIRDARRTERRPGGRDATL